MFTSSRVLKTTRLVRSASKVHCSRLYWPPETILEFDKRSVERLHNSHNKRSLSRQESEIGKFLTSSTNIRNDSIKIFWNKISQVVQVDCKVPEFLSESSFELS